MSVNKYHLNTKNYPQFSVGVNNLNVNSIEASGISGTILTNKNNLNVVSSTFLVSNFSNLSILYPTGVNDAVAPIYFELLNFDLSIQNFTIQLDNFRLNAGRDMNNAVVVGCMAASTKDVNFLWYVKNVVRTATSITINFTCGDSKIPGTLRNLIGNIIVRY